MFESINQVIINNVRPQLQYHFGDIELLSVNEDTVEVRLLGACRNCPSAKITLIDIVEAAIKEEFPHIKNVFSINETSEDLMDFAVKLLNKNNDHANRS